jgi:hypothetical protein
MCGGIRFMMASVMNSLRKSWGENNNGAPATPVSPSTAMCVWLWLPGDLGASVRRLAFRSGVKE